MLDSLLMAFSLYSRLPVPQTRWDEKNMRYCICFLPLVGTVIGAAQALASAGLSWMPLGAAFRGALLTALPVFLSGGIHMDGFLDTCDAIHSCKGREERLVILKDPHVGAFAVLGGILYFILDFGIWTEAGSGGNARETGVLCLGFVLSRALSALAALTFPKAKKDGMLRQETDPASRSRDRSGRDGSESSNSGGRENGAGRSNSRRRGNRARNENGQSGERGGQRAAAAGEERSESASRRSRFRKFRGSSSSDGNSGGSGSGHTAGPSSDDQ